MRSPPAAARKQGTTIFNSQMRASVLSAITGGGKWVEIKVHADPLYPPDRHR
jgi:hypothetical protein